MFHFPKKITAAFLIFVSCISTIHSQGNTETELLLDLRKTRADYENTLQKYQNDSKLFEEKAISANDYNRSKNELLSKEVDYQKLILKLISQQSYITVERAVKYQDKKGNRKVKVILKSALEGNEEYLSQFREHFDIFTPEMRAGKIYTVYVSLIDNETKTIIGSPYEYRIPSIEMGKTGEADFELLKDMESLIVSLNYNNKKDEKNIYLKKDASVNNIDITSMQFSQEADLGNRVVYDLTLERFSVTDDIYKLEVKDLPRQVSSDFTDGGTNKISQIRFAQGDNIKKLSLQIYLPERDDEEIVIDRPVQFEVVAVSASSGDKAGSETLEVIPRGKAKVEVRVNNLYYETSAGKSIEIDATIRNTGSRSVNNISVKVDKPLSWEAATDTDLIQALEPGKERVIKITVTPPADGTGAQEIKIRTEAMSDSQRVNTEDKTIRIQVNAPKSVTGTLLLILLLAGVIGGIVWFGMKLSKK